MHDRRCTTCGADLKAATRARNAGYEHFLLSAANATQHAQIKTCLSVNVNFTCLPLSSRQASGKLACLVGFGPNRPLSCSDPLVLVRF
jgi:hypothetical protein